MIDIKNKTILVTGASGNQGMAVVDNLLRVGWKVKALTRGGSRESVNKLRQMGAGIYIADLNDRLTINKLMKNIYGVFALTTSQEQGTAGEIFRGKNLADSALKAGVKHFVYSSVAGSDQNTRILQYKSKRVIEQYIKDIGLNYTIFRPVFFMYNFNMPELKKSISEGILRLPLKPGKLLQMIAPDDLGIFVRMAFESPEMFLDKSIDIAGDEMTLREAAGIFTARIGCRVVYEEIPIEMIQNESKDDALMFEWLNDSNFKVDIKSLKTIHPGLMTLDNWLYNNGWSKSCIMKAA